jgi:hypothetical protein
MPHCNNSTSNHSTKLDQAKLETRAHKVGKLGKVEVLVDRRRKLPFVTRAVGDRLQVEFAADNPRLAWHIAYELAGW